MAAPSFSKPPPRDSERFDDWMFQLYKREDQGLWTPSITMATPGNLTVAYTTQTGYWSKSGNQITAHFNIVTSTFTHTTSAGACSIVGSAHISTADANFNALGSLWWQGITKANYTQVSPYVGPSYSGFTLVASGSGQAIATVDSADMPTGGTVVLRGSVTYRI